MPIWIFIHDVLRWIHAVQGLCQSANLNNMRTLFIAGWLHLFELFWMYYLQNEKRYTGNHLDIWTHLDICDSVEPPFSKYRIFSKSDIHVFERISCMMIRYASLLYFLKSTHWVLNLYDFHSSSHRSFIIKISHLSYRYNTPV